MVAAQQQVQDVELVSQIGGSTYAVVVQGNYAYIGVGPRLVILDVFDPAHPAVVGQAGVLDGVVQGVAVAGNYACVADPAHPTEVGSYALAWTSDVAVAGNYAYVADYDSGLRIINITEPTRRRRERSAPTTRRDMLTTLQWQGIMPTSRMERED